MDRAGAFSLRFALICDPESDSGSVVGRLHKLVVATPDGVGSVTTTRDFFQALDLADKRLELSKNSGTSVATDVVNPENSDEESDFLILLYLLRCLAFCHTSSGQREHTGHCCSYEHFVHAKHETCVSHPAFLCPHTTVCCGMLNQQVGICHVTNSKLTSDFNT